MDSDALTHEQCDKLVKSLFPGFNFIARLKTRMERRGFRPNDPVYLLVAQAHDVFQRLNVELHYRSCKSGVFRGTSGATDPPKFEPPAKA